MQKHETVAQKNLLFRENPNFKHGASLLDFKNFEKSTFFLGNLFQIRPDITTNLGQLDFYGYNETKKQTYKPDLIIF